MLRAEALGGPRDLAVAARELLDQSPWHTRELEVLPFLPCALLDREALLGELLRQGGAVERPDLTRATEHGPRPDRDDPVILTHRACDHDMAVQLGVRRLGAGDTPCGGVAVGRRDHVLRMLLDDLAVIATTHHRNALLQVADRTLDRPRMRRLDLLTLPRIPERPHDRHRLRRAERYVNPAATVPVSPGRTEPLAAARVAAFHQRNELGTVTGADPSIPRRASVSGSESHRPGASVSSPSGVR